jgi:cysteine desulfurase
MFKKSRVYLDYAAATPLLPAAFKAMKPWLQGNYANASAIHQEGVSARRAIESARELIARTIEVRPEFVTFVSGGTEANNIAILGTLQQLNRDGRAYDGMEVITTRIEHPSILEAVKAVEKKGVKITYAPVTTEGKIDVGQLRELLTPATVLVSFAYANSEIGTVQPVRAIKRVLEEGEGKFSTKIFLHLDAAQAPLWLNCQVNALQADLLAFDMGKCHGPKGMGALVVSRRVTVQSVFYGGGQESGLRPGTENVAGIVGASLALADAQAHYKKRAEAVSRVRDAGLDHLLKIISQAASNGSGGDERLANNINISIPGLDTEFTTIVLDKHGFAVSTKSACAGAGGGESVVVREISGDPARAASTLRISLGPEIKLKDIQELTTVLEKHLKQMVGLT